MAGRRPLLGLSLAALFGLILLLSLSSSALAGTLHPFESSFPAGSNPQALTVDQASGDVLVIDVAAGAVLKFDAAGNPASFSALGTNVLDGASGADQTPHGAFSFDSPSAAQVAVDNSGGPADGFLYVANLSGAVDVFDTTGTFVGEIDGSAASPQNGGELCGVATDPTGHVYASYFSGHVDKYAPTNANPAEDNFEGQLENVGSVCNIAADGLGNVYVSGWPNGPLTRYDSSQLNQAEPSGSVVASSSQAVAVEPETNDVLVDEGDHVAQFTSSGESDGSSGHEHLSGESRGVGIQGATGDLYASDSVEGVGQIAHFGPGEIVPNPTVTIEPPTGVTTSHATFHGTVNPGGTEPISDTTWHFEYSTDGGATWTSTAGGDAGTGTSPVGVSDEVSTLLPHQEVRVRLAATNGGGQATSTIETFNTPTLAPDATTERAQDITPDHAALTATLNAHNAPTTYFFEYGTTTAYGTSIPASQDGDGGSSPTTTGATRAVYGLTPGTPYHYRIVAHNAVGTTRGADQTFTTTIPPAASSPRQGIPGTGFLSDDRGWEQASPPTKHGADVLIDSARTRAATTETPSDSMAATFSSLGAFADVHGTNVSNEYMTIRSGQPGTSGWVTHGITPPQQPLTFRAAVQAFDSVWVGDFSPDLSQGVYRSWTPLTNDPNVNDVVNLYRRDDLRTSGQGSYQLLTACPLCNTPLPPIAHTSQLPWFAGASSDFGHVIFESTYPLVSGSTASRENPDVYEWDHGTLRLAGILPDSACATPPCVAPTSLAGVGTGADGGGLRSSPHTISSDGSRIIFTDTSTGTSSFSGKLYMRINATSTIQLNGSEKTSPDASQPAKFQTASSDGTRVFFTTDEQLTNTPTNGTRGLYMYDTTAPAGHHLMLISVGHGAEDTAGGVDGVIGASADGHYVYFVAGGQLVAAQPVLGSGLGVYEWHDGVTSFISGLSKGADESSDVLPNFWGIGPVISRVAPDGKHMLYQSNSGLTGYPSQGHTELYLYSADSHELECASCRPDGTSADGDAGDVRRTFTGGAGTASHLSRAVTDDGSRVFFSSTDALVPQDTNGKSDAYEFDTASGTVHLLSSGADNSDSFFMDASASGNDAFLLTRQQLVGWDTDQNYDLYDARAGGGLPEPLVTPPCSGEGCRGPYGGQTTPAAPGSKSLQGPGNLAATTTSATLKPLTKAQKLAKALKVCRKKPKRQRRKCEAQTRRRYPVHRAAKKMRRVMR